MKVTVPVPVQYISTVMMYGTLATGDVLYRTLHPGTRYCVVVPGTWPLSSCVSCMPILKCYAENSMTQTFAS